MLHPEIDPVHVCSRLYIGEMKYPLEHCIAVVNEDIIVLFIYRLFLFVVVKRMILLLSSFSSTLTSSIIFIRSEILIISNQHQ